MQRFWSKVDIKGPNDCWMWLASSWPVEFPYGGFRYGNRSIRAHRAAWLIVHGEIPDGMRVCHKCDNTLCVNPAHLFLGTQKDNMRDASNKKRLHSQRKTHCKDGHELTGKSNRGWRFCRECVNQRKRDKRRMPKTYA